MDNLKLDLSFNALTKLFTENGVTLERCALTTSYPKCCVVSALGVINGTTYSGLSFLVSDSVGNNLESLEAGFEGWEDDGNYVKKYYKIGQRLYKWSQSETPQL